MIFHRNSIKAVIRRADLSKRNRPHVQSTYMISYPIPTEPSNWPMIRLCVVVVLAFGLLVALLNYRSEPPMPSAECLKTLDNYYRGK